MSQSAKSKDPDPRRALHTRRARVMYLVALGTALVAAVVWTLVNGARSARARHAGPMSRVVPSLPKLDTNQLVPKRLPIGLRWDDGRVVADSDGAELVYVPGGVVQLTGGTTPAHAVTVRALYMDRHEVTVQQFRSFCSATGTTFPQQPESSGAQHPVVDVSWQLAREYGQWAGRRLPTEAEWQRAACSDDGRTYPWGGMDKVSARNGPGNGDGWAGLAPVGSFLEGASPFGCVDMSGNAWEWCEDSAPPEGVGADRQPFVYRVLKGGSALWEEPLYLKATSRAALVSFNIQRKGVGFRLVRDE